jgi:predicted nucleic acid-binding protein
MTKRTVYVETSVIGYATSRPSRDLVIAAHQQITRDWFLRAATRFELFVSEAVIDEIEAGDETAAHERKELIRGLPSLAVNAAVGELARTLVTSGAIPGVATEDAIHVAVAAVHGVEFLVTWNCRHIANAVMRDKIERSCADSGCRPPFICTPEELLDEQATTD